MKKAAPNKPSVHGWLNIHYASLLASNAKSCYLSSAIEGWSPGYPFRRCPLFYLPNASTCVIYLSICVTALQNSSTNSTNTPIFVSSNVTNAYWSSAKTSLTVFTASFWTSVRLAAQSTSNTSLACSRSSGSSKTSICDRTMAPFM